ncbi:MAG: gluconate 2-dehydrogenase subunit 3 family protein [Rhodospirillales bacterium]|nr:gluconate 2-dehydrogenase subunit 3 family protein [Rhodospirillales bacterium]
MRVLDKRVKLSRRRLLGSGGASLMAMTILPGGAIVGAGSAWAANAQALEPTTFATLVQMSRDIYPHDRLADGFYAKAVETFDRAAAASADDKTLFEAGVAGLDRAARAAHGVPYAQVGWERDRAALLESIESEAFFQRVRASLITGLYNNPEVWPVFGYEGESASQGGYLYRGFDDIDWLGDN